MDTLSGILASMPPDPRSLTAGGPPAALSQATPTSAGPAGATAQTGGFVQPGEGKAATTPAPAASNGTAPTAATGTGAHDTLSSWATGISSFLSGPSPESNAASAASVGAYGPGPIGISSLGGLNPALLGGMGAGGLASSPLVPRPGETIDPKTGKPHVAGLTRAELEAKREAEAATAKEGVSTASSVAGPGKALEDLGGKEQAARQLTGTVPVPAGAETNNTGSAAAAQHTVMGDVNFGLEKVVGMLPQSLKERIAGVNDPKGKMTQQEAAYRLSPHGLLETAKNQGGKLFQDVKDAIHDIQGDLHERSAAHATADEEAGRNPGMIASVKEFWADVAGSGDEAKAQAVVGGASMPSKEVEGAKPGDFSTGVGALPGKSTEAGVAVLPDEKKTLVEQNQGALPGEVPVTKSALSPEPSQPKQPSTGSNVPAAIVGVAAAGTAAYALAAPLPYTSLGQGAAHGATDLDSVKGVSTSNSSAASAESASPASTTTASAARLAPPGTASGGERSTSMASITAINRGHEGNRQSAASPLVESTLANDKTPESASSKAALGAGVAGVAGGAALAANGVRKSESGKTSTELKDSAPGRHEDSLGHPSTRAPETTREPGTYPKADLNGPAVPDKHSEAAPDPSKTKAVPVSAAVASGATKNDTPVSPSTGGLGNAGTVPATSPRASTVASTEPPQTPKSPTNGNVTVVGDDTASSTPKQSGTEAKRRTSSGGSSKKKVGFMSKLKGEIKVLSGKLDNDKDKVEAGKRMMHGE